MNRTLIERDIFKYSNFSANCQRSLGQGNASQPDWWG